MRLFCKVLYKNVLLFNYYINWVYVFFLKPPCSFLQSISIWVYPLLLRVHKNEFIFVHSRKGRSIWIPFNLAHFEGQLNLFRFFFLGLGHRRNYLARCCGHLTNRGSFGGPKEKSVLLCGNVQVVWSGTPRHICDLTFLNQQRIEAHVGGIPNPDTIWATFWFRGHKSRIIRALHKTDALLCLLSNSIFGGQILQVCSRNCVRSRQRIIKDAINWFTFFVNVKNFGRIVLGQYLAWVVQRCKTCPRKSTVDS